MFLKFNYALLFLFLLVTPLSAQKEKGKEYLLIEKCKITMDANKSDGVKFNAVPGEIKLTKTECTFIFEKNDKGNKAKAEINGIKMEFDNFVCPLSSLHDFNVTNGGKSLQFLKNGGGKFELNCRIETPKAEQIMNKIIELQKSAK